MCFNKQMLRHDYSRRYNKLPHCCTHTWNHHSYSSYNHHKPCPAVMDRISKIVKNSWKGSKQTKYDLLIFSQFT